MRILTVPEDTDILRTKSQLIKEVDAELMAFLRDLGKTLKRQKDPAGVGLSAIQVGKPIRVFAIYLPEEENNEQKTMSNEEKTKSKKQKAKIVFYINPEIIGHSKDMTLGEDLVEKNQQPITNNSRPFLEGCLSIPDIYGPVLRWPWIKAKTMVVRENDLLDISRHGRLDLQLLDTSTINKKQVFPRSGILLRRTNFRLETLAGRVFQHELDHLNGILFTDHTLAQGNKFYQDNGNGMEEVNL